MTKMENPAKIPHDFCEYLNKMVKRGPLGSGDFDENGENLPAMVKMAKLAKNRLRADENLNEASRGAPKWQTRRSEE